MSKPSDNPSRLERSRKAALDAAITIVTRDGSGCLTPDAIARESGLSKGGVMHQLRIKEAVRRASSRTADDAFRGVLEPLPREGARTRRKVGLGAHAEPNFSTWKTQRRPSGI